MKTEKRLIACSVLCLIIGVASVTPLLFLTPKAAKAATVDNSVPWFNVNIPYAYWETGNCTIDLSSAQKLENGTIISSSGETFNVSESLSLSPQPAVNESHAIILNFTANPAAKNDVDDARYEYYQLSVYSDKGFITNMTYFIGICRADSLDSNGGFHFQRDNWFDSNTTSGGVVTVSTSFPFNKTDFTSYIIGSSVATTSDNGTRTAMAELRQSSHVIGGSITMTVDNTTSTLIAELRQSTTVYIDLYRLGWVTLNGNSTVVTRASNAILQHVEMDPYGAEGFLYNNVFSQDQLSQIDLSSPMTPPPGKP